MFGIVVMFLFGFVARAEVIPLQKLNQSEQAQRIAGDLQAVKIYRDGLAKVMDLPNNRRIYFLLRSLLNRLPRREKKKSCGKSGKLSGLPPGPRCDRTLSP